MKELISLYLGHCGVKLGEACWELFAYEHDIGLDGVPLTQRILGDDEDFDRLGRVFSESPNGKRVPRTLFFDTAPDAIQSVEAGMLRDLLPSSSLMGGDQDASGNYSTGRYERGAAGVERIKEGLRQVVEGCDSLQGILCAHAMGGGTGTGVGAVLWEELASEYGKQARLSAPVFPSHPAFPPMPAPMEAYNSILGLPSLMHSEASFVMDNGGLYDISQGAGWWGGIPTFRELNCVIAHNLAAITSPIRFGGTAGGDAYQEAGDYTARLVPFTRIPFLLSTLVPSRRMQFCYDFPSNRDMLEEAFSNASLTCRADLGLGRYLSAGVLICEMDNWKWSEVAGHLRDIGGAQKWVDWVVGTGTLGCGVSRRPCRAFPNPNYPRQLAQRVSMMVNTSAVMDVFTRMSIKFDQMYTKRAHVHHYTGSGMEESEFESAREELTCISSDYTDLSGEPGSEGEFGSDDDI